MRQAGIFFIENFIVDSLLGYYLVVYSLLYELVTQIQKHI